MGYNSASEVDEMFEVLRFKAENGKEPVTEWLGDLDVIIKARVLKGITKVRLGLFINVKSVGDGVFEIKLDFGPGYRIYFGWIGEKIILLLCAGDKSTQERDIEKAKEYWGQYRSDNND